MKKKHLLNEIMGVPRAVDFWVENFALVLTGLAKGIIMSDELESSDITYKNAEGEEVNDEAFRGMTGMNGQEFTNYVIQLSDYSSLKELIKDPRFKQFPLYNPRIRLTLYFLPEEIFNLQFGSSMNKSDFVEASHGFDASDPKLIKLGGDNLVLTKQEFTFQVYLKIEDLDNFNESEFKKILKPVIGHELTHAYETYNRVKTKQDPFQGRETFLNAAAKMMSDEKYPQWGEFLHLVYLHLSFEINARITQLYYSLQDANITNSDEFINEIKSSSVWKEITMLENFNAENFVKSFKTPEGLNLFSVMNDLGKQLERQSQGLPSIGIKKTPKEGMTHLIAGWDYVLQKLNRSLGDDPAYKGKLMDMVPQKAKEDPYQFFKFFEDRFHKKAKNFKRKVLRLAPLVLDKNLY